MLSKPVRSMNGESPFAAYAMEVGNITGRMRVIVQPFNTIDETIELHSLLVRLEEIKTLLLDKKEKEPRVWDKVGDHSFEKATNMIELALLIQATAMIQRPEKRENL